MSKFLRSLGLAILSGLLLSFSGCGSKTSSLVVTRVTHFLVQGNGESLNFPLFAETIGIETIERDLAIAEYYHEKLSGLYNFKSFSLINSAVNEYLLNSNDDLGSPLLIYEHEDSLTSIELTMIQFEEDQAVYSFRITDQRNHQTRHHQVAVQNGQSASIGLLFDEENNRGHLIVINLNSISITPQTTAQEFADFLKRKNSLADSELKSEFVSGDQRWMDELFGGNTISLPLPVPTPPDKDKFIEFDSPPAPVKGMIAFQEAVKYPEAALKERREGRVLLKVHIDLSGKVTETEIFKSAAADLDSAAIAAAKSIEFKPAMKDGKPVSVWVTIPFDFKLNKESKP
jgi:TonB family protein